MAAAAALAMGLMAVAFLIACRIGNFSIVDVMWSCNFTPIAATFALLGSGLPARSGAPSRSWLRLPPLAGFPGPVPR